MEKIHTTHELDNAETWRKLTAAVMYHPDLGGPNHSTEAGLRQGKQSCIVTFGAEGDSGTAWMGHKLRRLGRRMCACLIRQARGRKEGREPERIHAAEINLTMPQIGTHSVTGQRCIVLLECSVSLHINRLQGT